MNDLAGWLLEQIAADEQVARAAVGAPETEWRGAFDGLVGCYDLSVYEHTHIKRWLPARVLAECDAKRRIVARFQETARPYADARQQEIHKIIEDEVLPFLAAPYADRPGYLDEWRTVVVTA